MANIKSAMKRAKVSDAKNLRNRMIKSSVKTAIKRFEVAVNTGDKTAAAALFNKTISTVDKAAAKGILHKNTANRKKARLSTLMAK